MSYIKFIGGALAVAAVGAATLLGVSFIGNVASTTSSVVTAPGRVVQKTLETDNIIQRYEWFHDAHAQFQTRVRQIAETKEIIASTKDDAERTRLRIELGAQKQSCRQIAAQYNANSTKTNQSIFKGREAPSILYLEACD